MPASCLQCALKGLRCSNQREREDGTYDVRCQWCKRHGEEFCIFQAKDITQSSTDLHLAVRLCWVQCLDKVIKEDQDKLLAVVTSLLPHGTATDVRGTRSSVKDEWKFALPKWHENDGTENRSNPEYSLKTHIDYFQGLVISKRERLEFQQRKREARKVYRKAAEEGRRWKAKRRVDDERWRRCEVDKNEGLQGGSAGWEAAKRAKDKKWRRLEADTKEREPAEGRQRGWPGLEAGKRAEDEKRRRWEAGTKEPAEGGQGGWAGWEAERRAKQEENT